MSEPAARPTSRKMEKELTLLNVYAIAVGTTLSAGFFLLPGVAFREAGPAMVLSYLIAAVPLIPAMFSVAELATAMPRAGGAYYFLDRSLGPLVGTIGGLGTWFALNLKTAFSLIGIGAYLGIFWPHLPTLWVATGLAGLFGVTNLSGSKKSGSLQIWMVSGLLVILLGFLTLGLPEVQPDHFSGFFDQGTVAVFSTAGLVYVSYVGVTKIASVSEEIKNPERNLPLGIFLAITTALLIYGVGAVVIVGTVPAEQLRSDLTPVATAAGVLLGDFGKVLLTLAALLAFSSVANAGILSASRYPLAMSRDHLLPRRFARLTPAGAPLTGIAVTVLAIVLMVWTLDVTGIAKLASAFQLLMFSLINLAVVVMRESGLQSYDAGYRSPLYPWMQIFGTFAPLVLIAEMGLLPILFTLGLISLGTVWYVAYARSRVIRTGAIYHLFARLGQFRDEGLDRELRGIMKEKGVRIEDPFDEVVARAQVMDLSAEVEASFEGLSRRVSQNIGNRLGVDSQLLHREFLEGSRIGATPVSHGAALPHVRLPELERSEMVLVRSTSGIHVELPVLDGTLQEIGPIHAFFFFVSPSQNPGQHLRILAQIAGRVDEEHFLEEWLAAEGEQELKEVLLRDEHFLSLRLQRGTGTEVLIGKTLRELQMPEGCLVALIRRRRTTLVPQGYTRLQEGDRLTLIGDTKGIRKLHEHYAGPVIPPDPLNLNTP